jgi:hypothetical protein
LWWYGTIDRYGRFIRNWHDDVAHTKHKLSTDAATSTGVSDTAAGFAGSINTSHVAFLTHFQGQWLNGAGVSTAFDQAAGFPDATYISRKNLKVFGYWLLGVNAYNR